MASGIFDDALIKHLWSSDECRAIFNDENRVRKWYEFEAALAIDPQSAIALTDRGAYWQRQGDLAKALVEQRRRRLLAAGVEPWLCLHHWDLPQALADEGGWLNRDIAGWFADYAGLIANRYGDRVRRFATFNEPAVFTLFGYGLNWHPPGMVDPRALHRAIHHVNLAHGAGVDAVRVQAPRALIGCIHNVQPSRPVSSNGAGIGEADIEAARLLGAYWNEAFPEPQVLGRYSPTLASLIEPNLEPGDLERIHRPIDWFGVNHYSPIYARANPNTPLRFDWADAPADVRRSQIGWQIDPEAFRDVLIDVSRRYHLPVYVTENGAGAKEQPDAAGEILDEARIDQHQRNDADPADRTTIYGRTLWRARRARIEHGIRAIVWHQGESDANQADRSRTLAGPLYEDFLARLITASRREIGREVPWFVARASYHVPGDESSTEIRAAQNAVCRDGLALVGPDTDLLGAPFRDGGGKGGQAISGGRHRAEGDDTAGGS